MKETRESGHDTVGLLSRRDLLNFAAYALTLPGTAEFFSAWLKATQQPQHAGHWQPPEPPLLRDDQPKFFSSDRRFPAEGGGAVQESRW